MSGREEHTGFVVLDQAIWLVLNAFAALGLHGVALGVNLFRVHYGPEPAHAVGGAPEQAGPRVARAGFEIVGAVVRRRRVVIGTRGFEQPIELRVWRMLRTH